MTDDVEAIIDAIRSAFASVPQGRITIHEAEVIDGYGSPATREEARQRDTEEGWDRVPDQDIEECTTALSHLDPQGWRYYIPAYMVWSLRHFREGSIVSDATIYTLDVYGGDSALRQHSMSRFQLLDEAQSRAVYRFLRYMAAHDDHVDAAVADHALGEHWGQFGESTDS